MNLTSDPWIPMMFQDGDSRLVSLEDAFARGDGIRDLMVTPPQRVAVMRLLVCVAQAALDGPADEAAWARCRPDIAPAVRSYLDIHRARFELHAQGNEGAFLQVPGLEPKDNAALDKLDFGLAAGHNSTLFDHAAIPEGRAMPDALTAIMLLTFQCFSPGGTIGTSRWLGQETAKTSEHAPCVEGSMLHTIIREQDLLSTIHMNLLTKETVSRLPNMPWGVPMWEAAKPGASREAIATNAMTYLGRLVPATRAIRLSSSVPRVTLVNGVSYLKLEEQREPAATVVVRKDGDPPRYLGIDLDKHPWRELGSVLATTPSGRARGALVLDHLVGEVRDRSIDIWTGGLAADKGKVLDVAEWSFHLSAGILGTSELKKYEEGVALANRASWLVGNAIEVYLADLAISEFAKNERGKFSRNDNKSRDHRRNVLGKARAWYWSQLDATYQHLVETAGNSEATLGGQWYKTVWKTMSEAFRRACPHQTPRQIRAFAKGEQRLRLKRPEG